MLLDDVLIAPLCFTPTFLHIHAQVKYEGCNGALWERCLVVHNYGYCPKVRLTLFDLDKGWLRNHSVRPDVIQVPYELIKK